MTTTPAPAAEAFARLGEVHPHHVERIRDAVARARVGTIAVFKPNAVGAEAGAREFFTGIRPGDHVVITSRRGTGSLSVQSTEHRGAHLSVYSGDDLGVLDPTEWHYEDIAAAKDTAERNAAECLSVARAARMAGSDDRALAELDTSEESYRLAFALGVFSDYVQDHGKNRL